MPWARFDDQMPTHRKVRPLTDAAFRLWVSSVCWSNAYGTDSVVLASEINLVSDVKRPHRVVPQLVANGLWEEIEGGWRIHDFFDYNKSKAQVAAERKQKTQRQGRWRENKKAADVDASVDASTAPSRDASVDVLPARPGPVLPTEVPQQGTPRGNRPTAAPAGAIPLIDALTAEGFVVTWDLGIVEWDRVRLAVEKSGIPAMVEYARRRNAAAKQPAYSVRAWLPGWATLPTLNSGARLRPAAPSAIGAPSEAASVQPPSFDSMRHEFARPAGGMPDDLDFGDAFGMPQ